MSVRRSAQVHVCLSAACIVLTSGHVSLRITFHACCFAMTLCLLQVCISLCAVVSSKVEVVRDPVTRRTGYQGQAVDIAESIAVSGQGGMTLVPQQTFRQLPVEVMSEQLLVSNACMCMSACIAVRSMHECSSHAGATCMQFIFTCVFACMRVPVQFCHWGEYQFKSSLMALDVYLALSKRLMSRLARYGPLRVKHDGECMHGLQQSMQCKSMCLHGATGNVRTC